MHIMNYYDMAVVNTFFEKKREHLVTYKSSGRSTQVDYILYRRSELTEVKNCKVIPGDHVAPQHRLLCVDLKLKRPRKIEAGGVKKIKWYRLKEESCGREFKDKVLGEISLDIEDFQEWWVHNATVIMKYGKEVLGETSGRVWLQKEAGGGLRI